MSGPTRLSLLQFEYGLINLAGHPVQGISGRPALLPQTPAAKRTRLRGWRLAKAPPKQWMQQAAASLPQQIGQGRSSSSSRGGSNRRRCGCRRKGMPSSRPQHLLRPGPRLLRPGHESANGTVRHRPQCPPAAPLEMNAGGRSSARCAAGSAAARRRPLRTSRSAAHASTSSRLWRPWHGTSDVRLALLCIVPVCWVHISELCIDCRARNTRRHAGAAWMRVLPAAW